MMDDTMLVEISRCALRSMASSGKYPRYIETLETADAQRVERELSSLLILRVSNERDMNSGAKAGFLPCSGETLGPARLLSSGNG
jgi:hypothetical protein